MSESNVARLADLQERSDSPAGTAADPEIVLRELESLGPEPDPARVQSLTATLARTLAEASQLTIETARERYVRGLHKTLRAPARFFDSALTDARPKASEASDSGQGRALTFEAPEPWPTPVDGDALLNELRQTLKRFVILEPDQLTPLVLWIVHTYTFDATWITPRLAITSPEKRCGKTLVLTLMRYLVNKPLMTANASPAAIFRCIESVRPTLLIDEADTFLHGKDELRGVLNSGHQKDGCVLRTVGDDHEPRAFATFSPCAIAMIGQLPDTLADRSVALRMAGKRPGEEVERFRQDRVSLFEPIRRQAARWANDARQILGELDPEVPEELNDRAADNWRPLLAIAETAGGPWPELARQAALENATASSSDETSAGVQLLVDLVEIFEHRRTDRLHTSEIVDRLIMMEERPWPERKAGRPLTARQLAKLLQPFGIRPRQVRIDTKSSKGYRIEDFEDALLRYLPESTRNIRKTPLESTTYDHFGSETSGTGVSDPKPPQTSGSMRVVSDVSDRQGVPRESVSLCPREVVEL